MRVGIACFPHVGGSGVVASELGKALCDRGYEVAFFSSDLPIRLFKKVCGWIFHPVRVPIYPVLRYPPYVLALASAIVEAAEKRPLDILHVHYAIPHSTAAWLAKEMLAAKGLPVPKVVTTLHGTDTYLVGLEPSYRPVVEFSLQRCDAVTSVSKALKQQTEREFKIGKEIEVIYNFIDLKQFTPSEERPRLRQSDNWQRTIVHVSNFRSIKRVRDVLRVFELLAKVIPCRLRLVGEGPEVHATRSLSYSLGLQAQVDFTGPVTEVERLLCDADLLLSSSEMESFGLAIAEAMACAVPVVATGVGGVPELMPDGEGGLLATLGDVSGMAQQALRILSDPQYANALGAKGRQRIEQHFSLEKIVPQYEQLYKRLLGLP